MVTTGPRRPTRPVGPPREMSRIHGGAGIKYQEYQDGWIYEVYSSVDSHSVVPRGKTTKILFIGRWLSAHNEDGVNYLTIWIPRKDHEELFTHGPPALRVYDQQGVETEKSKFAAWVDPNETLPEIPNMENLAERAGLV